LYRGILRDASFFGFLHRIDEDLAARARAAGCGCGGRLDSARYPRKPRGGPSDVDGYDRRASFCCAEEGCRKRVTPPSVRFLGRRVYLGVVVLLGAAMRHGLSPRRVAELRERLGVSRRTLDRWRRWWLTRFVMTSFWQAHRGRFAPPLEVDVLPQSLIDRFVHVAVDRPSGLVAALRFLSPLSTSSGTSTLDHGRG
jgi:hypothetical protein